MKDFTVGDLIKVLQKLDPALPLYDHYYDEELQQEVWFNLAKPKPKKQTLHLKATSGKGSLSLGWAEPNADGRTIEKKKVVVLYPAEKDVIEI
jgi:hypothetical protein